MKIAISKANKSDLNEIIRLNHELFLHDKAFDDQLEVEWPKQDEGHKYFQGYLESSGKIAFVARVGDKVVGYLVGQLTQDTTRRCRVVSLDNMCVTEAYRHQNIGSALMADFRKWAVAENAERISVTAYAENKNALHFYKKHRFSEIAITLEAEID